MLRPVAHCPCLPTSPLLSWTPAPAHPFLVVWKALRGEQGRRGSGWRGLVRGDLLQGTAYEPPPRCGCALPFPPAPLVLFSGNTLDQGGGEMSGRPGAVATLISSLPPLAPTFSGKVSHSGLWAVVLGRLGGSWPLDGIVCGQWPRRAPALCPRPLWPVSHTLGGVHMSSLHWGSVRCVSSSVGPRSSSGGHGQAHLAFPSPTGSSACGCER